MLTVTISDVASSFWDVVKKVSATGKAKKEYNAYLSTIVEYNSNNKVQLPESSEAWFVDQYRNNQAAMSQNRAIIEGYYKNVASGNKDPYTCAFATVSIPFELNS